MILTYKLYTPNYINDTLCGNDLITLASLGITSTLVIKVNGVEVVNTTGLLAEENFIGIATQASWEENTVEITYSAEGYHTYHNIFKVYGYDLGIPNGTDYDIPPFEIILIKEDYRTTLQQQPTIDDGFGNQIANPDYVPNPIILTYSSVIAYRKPFTSEIYYYRNVSFGDVTYYSLLTGEVFSSFPNGVIQCNTDFTIIPYYTATSSRNSCCCDNPVVVSNCLGEGLEVLEKIWLPYIGYNFVSENCDTSCINTIDKNKAIVEINFDSVSRLYIDGEPHSPITDMYLSLQVWGVGSELIDNKVKGYIHDSNLIYLPDYVNFAYPINVFDTDYGGGTLFRYEWEFDTPDIGDYIFNAIIIYDGEVGELINGISPVENDVETLTTNSVVYCTNNEVLSSCNWLELQQLSCNSYRIHNHSFNYVTLNIYKLNSDKTFSLTNNETISECNYVDIELLNDGIYKVEVTKTEDTVANTLNYILINYCGVENCYLAYLKNIICCNPSDDCNTKNVYNYNVFNSMVNVLMTQLNAEYNFNYVYEFITEDKIEELHNIDTILERINTEYCVNCESPSGCNEIISSECSSCN